MGISMDNLLVVAANPSEQYEFVSSDDDIPNIWKNNPFMFQTTNQLGFVLMTNYS